MYFYKKKSDELYGVIDCPLEAINGPIITNTSKHFPIWWLVLLCFLWTTIIALLLLLFVRSTCKGTIMIPCVTLGADFKQIQSELGSIITEFKSNQ